MIICHLDFIKDSVLLKMLAIDLSPGEYNINES